MDKQCTCEHSGRDQGPTGWRDRPRVRRHTITLGDDDDDDARQQNHGDGDGVVVPTPTPRDDGAPRDARRRSRRRNIHERCVSKRSRNERDDAREMRASRARARTRGGRFRGRAAGWTRWIDRWIEWSLFFTARSSGSTRAIASARDATRGWDRSIGARAAHVRTGVRSSSGSFVSFRSRDARGDV